MKIIPVTKIMQEEAKNAKQTKTYVSFFKALLWN